MPSRKQPPVDMHHEQMALVLQGGGALGAYQAGVYEAISGIPREPHWVAGVSIGAINAALIVGNPPERRVERLREFWLRVSAGVSGLPPLLDVHRSAFHQFSAAVSASLGVHGFYTPRVPPPPFQPEGTDAAISYYDTSPLRHTLEELIDFKLINSGKVRLSVGAVNVRSGNSIYFDNTLQTLGVEHVMASGALPPAFAPVQIDGESYWDGGILSNTPLQYVLDNRGPQKMVIAQVDLFSARGPLPTNMSMVLSRQKDIQYSSRTRFNTDQAARIQRDMRTIEKLIAQLPPAAREDPDVKALAERCNGGHVDIVHLIYRQNRFELESRDYEFSRATVLEHWNAGMRDMRHTVEHPDWLIRSDADDGVTVYDLTQEGSGSVKVNGKVTPSPSRRAAR